MVANPPELTDDLLRQGRFIRTLLKPSAGEWILRRTEKVELRSAHEYSLSVTLAIDNERLRRYEAAVGGLFPNHLVPVPLMLLRKQLMLDFEVAHSDG